MQKEEKMFSAWNLNKHMHSIATNFCRRYCGCSWFKLLQKSILKPLQSYIGHAIHKLKTKLVDLLFKIFVRLHLCSATSSALRCNDSNDQAVLIKAYLSTNPFVFVIYL